MDRLGRAALAAAVALSGLALFDAVWRGVTGGISIFDDGSGLTWAIAVTGAAHAVLFAALTAVLFAVAPSLDRYGTVVRLSRRTLLAATAVLAVGFTVLLPWSGRPDEVPAAVGAVAGIAFLVMFVAGVALGVALWRQPGWRLPAGLMAAPLVVIPLLVIAGVMGWYGAHPAYAEAPLYIGCALLARGPRQRSGADVPEPSRATLG